VKFVLTFALLSTVAFAQQTATRTGCLVFKSNGFLLQVDDSPEVLQLAGTALAANVGNRVAVTGTPSPNAATIIPATVILNVTALTQRAAGGCLTVAAALNAQTTVPGSSAPVAAAPKVAGAAKQVPVAAKAGLSTGAKVGIIAAIGGGGAGAALALGGKKDSTSP
jgi:hypothetical protein